MSDQGIARPLRSAGPRHRLQAPTDFDAFFAAEHPRLVAVMIAATGNPAVAEELAQEAMLRAHQRWNRVGGYDVPAAWVRRVALNLAHNTRARRRSEQRAMARLEAGRPAPQTIDDGGQADWFWGLVRRLPARQADAVLLHYLEDRPVTEVASILGCAEGTAKAHLHKGRANLARLLAAMEDPDGP